MLQNVLLITMGQRHYMLATGAGTSRLVRVACDRTSLLAACVAEAVRLRAPGIAVRMAACNLDVPVGHHTTVRVHKVQHSVTHGTDKRKQDYATSAEAVC